MSSDLLDYLSRNLSANDVLDLCDHVDRMLDADDVTEKIKTSTHLNHMLRVFIDYLLYQDEATLVLLLKSIEQDYNFIAYRIRKEYRLSHKVITDSQQDQNGLQLMLVSRPPDPLSCHPMRLSVPSHSHEQWDHGFTFAYTAPRLNKLDYQIQAVLSRVVDENGQVIRVTAFRCSEKCRTVSSDGTVPQISLWCRFKGYTTRTTQTVKFSLHATSGKSINIECASVCVDFQVKRKKKQVKRAMSNYRHPPSPKLVVIECDSSQRSCDTSSMPSCDTSQSSNEAHMSTWTTDVSTAHNVNKNNPPKTATFQKGFHLGLMPSNFHGGEHLFQLFHSMPKSKAYVYETNFGERSFMSMFKMFVGLMNNPQEFNRLARGMKKYFSDIMSYSDMKISVYILESTRAYAAGDVETSYRRTVRSKQLLPQARNPAVGLAEINIQLVGVFRRLRKFGLAVQMVQEAQQALSNTELCQTHAMVCKCEAVLYSLMLQNSPHPNSSLRTAAISLFWKAIDILHQTDNFHASPEHHIKECYMQLAEVYLDIPSSDIRSWRHVSADDIRQAALCLHKAQQMIRTDFYGRGHNKLKLTQAKLLIRKGQLTQAAGTLAEGIQIAQASGSLIDAQYCSELLRSIESCPEYALQTMKDLVVSKCDGREHDGADGDADTASTNACASDSCENDCGEV